MSSHMPIKFFMGGLILGVNTSYRLFCFFKLFPMVGKGLTAESGYRKPTYVQGQCVAVKLYSVEKLYTERILGET